MGYKDPEKEKDYQKAYQKAYREANKEKMQAYQKAYREANKEEIKVKRLRDYECNKEKRKAYQKAYTKANKAEIKTRKAFYYERNKEKIKARRKLYLAAAATKKHEALKKDSILPTTNFEAIKEIYKHCEIITKKTGIQHHVDHIVPLKIGGAHHQDNLRVITAEENMEKHSNYNSNQGGVWADNYLALQYFKDYFFKKRNWELNNDKRII